MAWQRVVGAIRHWWPARRRDWAVGDTEIEDARRLADAERSAGGVPDGCAWLDDRTVLDVDLPLVFRAIDRTSTVTGAQALWRWLAAPAVRLDVLTARERALARLAAAAPLRGQIRDALTGQARSDAAYLPSLLWEPLPPPVRTARFAVLAVALALCGVLAVWWWPPLAAGCVVLLVANVIIDDWVCARLANHGYALKLLGQLLASADRVITRGAWHDAEVAADLAGLAGFRKRIAWLTANDPLGIADLLRAGFLARLLLLGGLLRVVEQERARLRRIVLWLGELDALVSVASLRAGRPEARVPELSAGARTLTARGIVHPAIPDAVGNDVTIDFGLLLTGSNMSGKSTFLRTIAINAICAQSIHTTFGTWRAALCRVFAVMRIADATAEGMSTYAVEVTAIRALVEAVARRDHAGPALPALLVMDEPFRGTNPALRVPIVVAVLEHLADRDLVIAATHDLDVAAHVDRRFARGYFCEPDATTGEHPYELRTGVSPATNALALLVRAGYPSSIIKAVERRVSGTAGATPACHEPPAGTAPPWR